jgi:hypothetical protein
MPVTVWIICRIRPMMITFYPKEEKVIIDDPPKDDFKLYEDEEDR